MKQNISFVNYFSAPLFDKGKYSVVQNNLVNIINQLLLGN